MSAKTIVILLILHSAGSSIINTDNNGTENAIKKSAGFLFSMPKLLSSGQNETVCLTLHEAEVPSRAIIDLKWKEKHFTTYRNLETDHTCFDLYIPHLEIKEPHFVSVKIQVQLNGMVQSAHNLDPLVVYPQKLIKTFINTDRSVYKPGDKVRFRILVIDEKLLPQNSKIPEIRIKNPLDVTVTVWENLVPENGLLSLEYQMTSEAISGKWKIEVLGEQKVFEVFRYILPRFKIDLIHPKTIYYKADSLIVSVCGQYPYGRHVRGLAFIKITDSHNNMVPIHKLKEMENGCAEFKIPSEELNISNLKEKFPMYDPKTMIHITATLTEKGTNRIDVTTGKIPVILKPYIMKFIYNQIFQPGLPYRGKLQFDSTNMNLSNEIIEICYNFAIKRSWNYLNEEQCSRFNVGQNNSIEFSILPVKSNVIHINLNARSLNHTNVGDSLLLVRLFAQSNNYISLQRINMDKATDECRAPQYFKATFTADKFSENENLTFYFMIKSSSHIYKQRKIIHQVKKMVPDYANELTNIIGHNNRFTKLGTSTDSFQIKFRLDKKIVSKYQLLVYYVTNSGETIAINKHVDVDPCLMKVNASWNQKQMVPGATATLNVETGIHSLCSISAVDKSTKFLPTAHHNFDVSVLLHSFASEERQPPISGRKNCIPPARRNHQGISNLEEPNDDITNSTWDVRRKRHIYSFSEDFDSYDMFDTFGTVIITNFKLVTKPCYSGPLMKDASQAQFLTDYNDHNEEQAVSIRSHFPETWLWELIPVSESIQLNRHLPHTITNWVTNVLCVSEEQGVGISEEFEITSIQSFFVEVLTPHTVKREEAFYLTIHVSNYLSNTFPVRIILRLSDGLELKNPQDKLAVSYCLKENNTITHMLQVEAITMGLVNVTVLAEADTQYPEECGPETILSKRDVVLKTIIVQSEGYPMRLTRSSLLCTSDSKESTNVTWNIKTPHDVVAGTDKTIINLNADLLGNTIEHLEELIDVPTGCGEQIIATVAPNLYVLHYLNSTNTLKHSIRQRIIRNLKIGYQRILNYVHKDGSFSAFGYHDPNGSMFLTAFVVKTLQKAKQHVYIDQRLIDKAVGWIYEHQLENGCFNTMLHVFQDMGGTSKENSTASLTAYVMVSLLESNIDVPSSVLTNAKYCIRSPQNSDKYTLAISCYALFKMNLHYEAHKMLKRLLAVAERQNDMLWWSNKENGSSATDIEITSYVLLSLLQYNTSDNLAHAQSVVRWLSSKYGPKGGFQSTQDTVVALDALAKYARLVKHKNLNLNIQIQMENNNENFTLRNSDKMKSKIMVFKKMNSKINIKVQGDGCVLAQVMHSYYLKTIPRHEAFKLAIEVSPVSTIDQCSIASFSPCLAYTGPDGISNMAVMEITLPTGYEADRASLYKLVDSEFNSKVKMFEEENNKVNIYFTKLDKQLTCFEFNLNEYTTVDDHKNSLIKLYDYYNPEYEILQYYKLNENCRNNNQSVQIPDLTGKPLSTMIKIDNITLNLVGNLTTQNAHFSSENLIDNSPDRTVTTGEFDQTEARQIQKRDISIEYNMTHLNPKFVNKDIDMAMPNGIEGNLPIYVMPNFNMTEF